MQRVSRLLLISLWLCTLSVAIAVQPPPRIEETVPKELAQRKDIAGMISRLKFLRISADRLGKKHPSRIAVINQIKDLESRLSAAMGAKNDPVEEEIPTDTVENYLQQETAARATNDEDVITPRREVEESVNASSPEISSPDKPDLHNTTPADELLNDFKPAYPHLEFEHLTAVGPFPARGLLWGIEYDPLAASSKVWQWQDHPDTRKKTLYWETQGEIRDFTISHDFEMSGEIYVSRIQIEDSSADDENEQIEVLRLIANPLPPFERKSNSEELLAKSTGRFAKRNVIAAAADGGIYVASNISRLTEIAASLQSEECSNRVSRLKTKGTENWPLSSEASSAKWHTENKPAQLFHAPIGNVVWQVEWNSIEGIVSPVASEKSGFSPLQIPPNLRAITMSMGRAEELLERIQGSTAHLAKPELFSTKIESQDDSDLACFVIGLFADSSFFLGRNSHGEAILLQ